MIIVADSSPLVALAGINQLPLLEKIFSDVFIPEAVYREISFPGKPNSEILKIWARKSNTCGKSRTDERVFIGFGPRRSGSNHPFF